MDTAPSLHSSRFSRSPAPVVEAGGFLGDGVSAAASTAEGRWWWWLNSREGEVVSELSGDEGVGLISMGVRDRGKRKLKGLSFKVIKLQALLLLSC